jgi:gamma-glutamyltranspeptidase
VILGVTAFGLDLRGAVEAPRLHDQAVPPVLVIEEGVPADARALLERLGHRVAVQPVVGAVSAAGLDGSGRPIGAGDPRKDGGAAVVP